MLDPTKRFAPTFHFIHIALSTFLTQALALVFLSPYLRKYLFPY